MKYLGSSEQTHVRHYDFAYQIWDALKSYYNLQGEIEVANAQAQLFSIMQTKSKDITVYVRRLQELHSVLDNLGDRVTTTKVATKLLKSLNTHYRSMVRTIQTWSLASPSTISRLSLAASSRTMLEKPSLLEKGGDPLLAPPRGHAANYGGLDLSGRSQRGSGGIKGRREHVTNAKRLVILIVSLQTKIHFLLLNAIIFIRKDTMLIDTRIRKRRCKE